MPPDRVVLFSIRPEHAASILDGSKTVELRRVKPRIRDGDVALVYVTSPVCAVVAALKVHRVVVEPPRELWEVVERRAGVNRREYDDYYSGASTGVAIFVEHVTELEEPVPLADLQHRIPGFQAPQSFRYVQTSECDERILSALEA